VAGVSKFILGTVQLGATYGISNTSGKPSQKEGFNILQTAFESGIETLDTASVYGDAIEVIGKFHEQVKDRFQVISKFHLHSNELMAEEIERDLERLNIDKYEALLFHSFHDFISAGDKVFQKLEQLKVRNKVRLLGVSVYTNEQFEVAIENDKIDLIQFPYNLLDNWKKRSVLIKRAKQKGKVLHIRSVFLQGLFFVDEHKLPSVLSPMKPYLKAIHSYAADYNLSIAQIALSYVLHNPMIDKILVGVTSVDELKINIGHIKSLLPKKLQYEIDEINVLEVDLLNPSNWK